MDSAIDGRAPRTQGKTGLPRSFDTLRTNGAKVFPLRPFDRLRANGGKFSPFVVSLSNHRAESTLGTH